MTLIFGTVAPANAAARPAAAAATVFDQCGSLGAARCCEGAAEILCLLACLVEGSAAVCNDTDCCSADAGDAGDHLFREILLGLEELTAVGDLKESRAGIFDKCCCGRAVAVQIIRAVLCSIIFVVGREHADQISDLCDDLLFASHEINIACSCLLGCSSGVVLVLAVAGKGIGGINEKLGVLFHKSKVRHGREQGETAAAVAEDN